MFKRLRERLTEEANRFPVGQQAFNPVRGADGNGKADVVTGNLVQDSPEDLITLNDTAAVIPHSTSTDPFSIADEDGFLSDQSSPQKSISQPIDPNVLAGLTPSSSDYSFDVLKSTSSSIVQGSFVSQSETETEEPPSLNLESISKDQLLSRIRELKARHSKYKSKYHEVIKRYKELQEDKLKLENALTKNQDQSLRRMSELREQCQLEQKAKAHLESNLRLMIEEKDSRMSVLETQIVLLKESQVGSAEVKEYVTSACMTDELKIPDESEGSSLLKVESTPVTVDNTQLLEENRLLTQREIIVETLEAKENKLRVDHEKSIHLMKQTIDELLHQRETIDFSIAEMKQNMHKDMEHKENHIKSLQEEIQALNLAIQNERKTTETLKKQHEDKIKELQVQFETLERSSEEDRQAHKSVLQEKGNAIALLQQAHEKKIATNEEEWQIKMNGMQQEYEIQKNSCIQQIEVLKAECIKLENSLKEKVLEKDNLINSLTKENNELKEFTNKIQLEKKNDEFQINAQEEFKEVEVTRLKTKNEDLLNKYEQSQKECDTLQKQVSELRQQQNEHCFAEEERISAIRLKYDQEAKLLHDKIQQLKSEVTNLQELQQVVEDLTESNSNISQENDSLQKLLTVEKEKLVEEKKKYDEQIQLHFKKLQEIDLNYTGKSETYQIEAIELKTKIDQLQLEKQQLINFQDKAYTIEMEMNKMTENLENLEEENVNIKISNEDLKKKLDELEPKFSKLQEKNKEYQILLEDKEKFFKTELKYINTKNKSLENELLSLKTSHHELKTLTEQQKRILAENESKMSTASEINKLEIEEMNKRICILQSQNKELLSFQDQVCSSKAEVNQLKCDLENLTSENINIKKSNNKLRQNLTELEPEFYRLQQKDKDNQLLLENKENSFNVEFNILSEKYKMLETEFESFKTLFIEKDNELKILNEQHKHILIEKEDELNALQKNHEHETKEMNVKIREMELQINKLKEQRQTKQIATELKENIINEGQLDDFVQVKRENIELIESSSYELNMPNINQIEHMGIDNQDTLEKENMYMSMLLECSGINKSDLNEIMEVPLETEHFSELLKDFVKNKLNSEKSKIKSHAISSALQTSTDEYAANQNNFIIDNVTEYPLLNNNTVHGGSPNESSEIAALKVEVKKKEEVLQTIRNQYENAIQEKIAKIKELESQIGKQSHPSANETPSIFVETSDWDDTWVVPDEVGEASYSVSSNNECEEHIKEIDTLKKEITTNRSEIKDLRLLLRLSPPQSSHSSESSLPEPTELEYLKNIIYHYMMGKETSTLAKVIAAVLKFDDDQTKTIIEKEKSKLFTK